MLHAQAVLYQTGFESPTFAPGNLAGQDNWVAGVSASQSAAQIIATNGGQEVQISGPQVAQTSPTLYNSTFSRTLTNYDPVVSGTPIVDLSADLWQQQGATTSQATNQNGFLILYDQNSTILGTMGINKNGLVFGENLGTPNQLVNSASPATNGFRNFKIEFNFTTRTMNFFLDVFNIVSEPFGATATNKLGVIRLIYQGSNPLTSSLYVDNLSVTVRHGRFHRLVFAANHQRRAMPAQRFHWHSAGWRILWPQCHRQRQRHSQPAISPPLDNGEHHELLRLCLQHGNGQWLYVAFAAHGAAL